MNYGQKIAELRKSNNLTQAELGAKLNITAQAVSKWENNLSEPDIDSIRRMCEMFNISVDEFLGVNITPKTLNTTQAEPIIQTKIINGYCENCKKPVSAGEYTTSHLSYDPNSLIERVSQSTMQHIYCNDCYKTILDIKKKDEELDIQTKAQVAIETKKIKLKKGFIWGTVACVVMAIILFISYSSNKSTLMLTSAIIGSIGSFTTVSQMFWNGAVADVLTFFCRSFKAPFGLIFELSIDGIIWLITVKFALWLICGLLSFLWFILGIGITLMLSIIMFPFSLGRILKNKKICA